MRTDAVADGLRAVLADDTFARRFDVGDKVGEGGMGRVHRAIDRESGAHVALKVLRDPGVEARFTLEAETLERMDHPAIVAYVGHGVTRSGEAYLAMAWLDGESLATRLVRGPLSIADTLAIGIRIAGALAHAHAHSIVHRDVKPSNVMLVDSQPARATLIDFGIAKDTAVTHGLTETGQLIGTPGYMAPEQAMGTATPAAAMDVFGLGALLYECCTGRPPFEGKQTMEVLAQLLLRDPPPARSLRDEVPVRLDALIMALLEKEPERRTAQASQVEAELRAIERHLANRESNLLAQRPSWVPERVEKPTALERPSRARRPLFVASVAVGLAIAIAVTIIVIATRTPDSSRPSPSTASARAAHPCQQAGGDACERACEANEAVACRLHGRELYVASDGNEEQRAVAVDVLGKGCTLGDASACVLAGQWVRRNANHGDKRYTREAWVKLLERGCELEPGTACALLAEHLSSESPEHRARALQLYERQCTTNPAGCYHAADILQHGDAADRARAVELRETACSRGYTRACK
ncbi:MAG: protein kinase [Kofleriaceae bacterium]